MKIKHKLMVVGLFASALFLSMIYVSVFSMVAYASEPMEVELQQGRLVDGTGKEQLHSSSVRSGYLPVQPDFQLDFVVNYTSTMTFYHNIFLFDSNYNFMGTAYTTQTKFNGSFSYVVPDNVAYIRFVVTVSYISPTNSSVTYTETSLVDDSSSMPDDSSSTSIPGGGDSSDISDSSDSSQTSTPGGGSSVGGGDSSIDDSSIPQSTPDTPYSAPRPFLTTPLDDFSVTEGLLLVAVVLVSVGTIIALMRGR